MQTPKRALIIVVIVAVFAFAAAPSVAYAGEGFFSFFFDFLRRIGILAPIEKSVPEMEEPVLPTAREEPRGADERKAEREEPSSKPEQDIPREPQGAVPPAAVPEPKPPESEPEQSNGTTAEPSAPAETGALTLESAEAAGERWQTSGSVVMVGRARLSASDAENVQVLSLTVHDEQNTARDALARLLLTENGHILAEKTNPSFTNGSERLDLTGSSRNLVVPQGGAKTIVLQAELSEIGAEKPLEKSGVLVALSAGGSGDNSGIGLMSDSEIAISGSAEMPPMRVFSSFPTLAPEDVATAFLDDGVHEVYRFSIRAAKSGAVAVRTFSFGLNARGINVAKFVLRDAITREVVSDTTTAYVRQSQQSEVVMPMPVELSGGMFTVSAGEERTLQLRADIERAAGSTDWLEVRLLGDTEAAFADAPYLRSAGSVEDTGRGNFIWSPVSGGSADLEADDWANGYLVPGLAEGGLGTVRLDKTVSFFGEGWSSQQASSAFSDSSSHTFFSKLLPHSQLVSE